MPRNKYPEETVKKILETSLRLFLEKGFEQTTVLDIVNNLGGLTRGAFYHHFKSKDEVLDAIFLRADIERDIFEKARKADVPNGLERLKYTLKLALASNMADEQNKAITSLAASLLTNPRFLAEHIKSVQESARLFATFMDEAMADGSMKKGNSKAISELFMLLVNVWMMPNIFPPENIEEMEVKGEMLDQIFTALGYNFVDEEMGELYENLLSHIALQKV